MVYGEREHSRLLFHVVLKQPNASGTGDATDQKLGFLASFNRRNKGLLYQRVIQLSEPVQFRARQLAGCNGGLGTELVKASQAFTVNGFAHRLTALTTEESCWPSSLSVMRGSPSAGSPQ